MQEEYEIQEKKKDYICLFFALICSILSIILVFLFIAGIYHPENSLNKLPNDIAVRLYNFAPEPLERMFFITGVILSPILITFFFFLIKTFISIKIRNLSDINKLYKIFIFLSLIIIIVLSSIDIVFNPFYYDISDISDVFVPLLIFSFFLSYIFVYKDLKLLWLDYIVNIICYIFILLISLNSLCDLYNFNNDLHFGTHFGTVFYAISQVFSGKVLLVDFIHQYGLYPHFLEPLLKITGLTPFKFTIIMGILNGISFFYLYKFLREVTENKIIASLGFLTMIWYNYFLGYFFQIKFFYYDPFFQYHPVRFLFPSLSIYITWRYFKKNNSFLYFSSFFFYSFAVLWNFDTGLVVFFSWLLLLIYKELVDNNVKIALKKIVKHLLYGFLIFLTIFFLYNFYIKLRYGVFPDFISSIKYQKIFYFYGFYMLPMKIIHPWNLVVLVYLYGLAYGIKSFFIRKADFKTYAVVFLSILGFGIFSYFQGRSVDPNLLLVSYPALLLLTIFIDEFFSRKPSFKLSSLLLISFLLFTTVVMISKVPLFFINLTDRFEAIIEKEPTNLSRNACFIINNTKPGEKVFIISNHSGVYYTMSHTICPLNISSITEFFLKEDYYTIYRFLKENKHSKVFVDNTYVTLDLNMVYNLLEKKERVNLCIEVPENDNGVSKLRLFIMDILIKEYKAVKLSSDGNMMLFEKD